MRTFETERRTLHRREGYIPAPASSTDVLVGLTADGSNLSRRCKEALVHVDRERDFDNESSWRLFLRVCVGKALNDVVCVTGIRSIASPESGPLEEVLLSANNILLFCGRQEMNRCHAINMAKKSIFCSAVREMSARRARTTSFGCTSRVSGLYELFRKEKRILVGLLRSYI